MKHSDAVIKGYLTVHANGDGDIYEAVVLSAKWVYLKSGYPTRAAAESAMAAVGAETIVTVE